MGVLQPPLALHSNEFQYSCKKNEAKIEHARLGFGCSYPLAFLVFFVVGVSCRRNVTLVPKRICTVDSQSCKLIFLDASNVLHVLLTVYRLKKANGLLLPSHENSAKKSYRIETCERGWGSMAMHGDA